MDYYNRIQKSIDYIEQNLDYNITLSEVAYQASCSLYHYHRIFQAMVGYSVKDYIRKRRLSCAARELFSTNTRIIDIALKYQYATHESFSRAFAKEVGLSPKEYKKCKEMSFEFKRVNVYSNIYQTALQDKLIGPKIIWRNDITVIGVDLKTTKRDEIDFKQIPIFWNNFFDLNLGDKIPHKQDRETYLGYSCDFDEKTNYTYMICSEIEQMSLPPKGMVQRTIPASNYASFDVKGTIPDYLINAWRYIYNTWLPNSGLELIGSTDFEELNITRMNKDIPEVTIYIPIKK